MEAFCAREGGPRSGTPEPSLRAESAPGSSWALGPRLLVRRKLVLRFVLPLMLYSFKLVATGLVLRSAVAFPSLPGNGRGGCDLCPRGVPY